jgi:preprotein translocase subunit SecA
MFEYAMPRGAQVGVYPERRIPDLSPLDQVTKRALEIATLESARAKRRCFRIPALVSKFEVALASSSRESLTTQVAEIRSQLKAGATDLETRARAFAIVREASSRTLGKRHHDVQLIGASLLLDGFVAEMDTGEGKTLTAALAASVAALRGTPVHVITVNDYLASRDAAELSPLYAELGLSVGVVVSGISGAARRDAYRSNVTYVTNKEVAFDYLRDRVELGSVRSGLRARIERLADENSRLDRLVHRGLHFAIVDEADSVLVDEARTPLIIGKRDGDSSSEEVFRTAVLLASQLREREHYRSDEKQKSVQLTEAGSETLEQLSRELGGIWRGAGRREAFVSQALSALLHFRRDQHYLVQDGRVQIIDEYTGRLMPDRSWEHALHQMIEIKEGVRVTGSQEPLVRMSYQRFFSRYLKLAGMTGTAREVSVELHKIYGLRTVRVPTHSPSRRTVLRGQATLDVDMRWARVVDRILEVQASGRPILVGTRSVEASEHLSGLLTAAGVEHLVLNARQDKAEAQTVASAGRVGTVTVATNMAGRGTDIQLGPGVAELGGLHVLCTEAHDARRIDRQLFGRCGRQGDPGTAELIVSLEDEVCRLFASGLIRMTSVLFSLMRLSIPPLVIRTIARVAQEAAQRHHLRQRRELLRADLQLETMLAFSGRRE